MERKLASVQKVTDVKPIEGYDRVELAYVLGFTLIVGKDSFKSGDFCIYFEPDSKLYPHEIWDEFLAKRNYKIKSMRMCGVISQGLALPFEDFIRLTGKNIKPVEGLDLTELLNVRHIGYKEPKERSSNDGPIVKYLMRYKIFRNIRRALMGKSNSDFPTDCISKSGETNLQSVPNILKYNKEKPFYFSEKLEGQSATYIYRPKTSIFGKDEFIVCSHNKIREEKGKENNWWTIAKNLDMKMRLVWFLDTYKQYLAIQGEIVGPGIQGNIYNLDALDFYVYKIRNIETKEVYPISIMIDICKNIGLKHVPILHKGYYFTDETVEGLLDASNGKSDLNEKTLREGLVVRSHDMSVSFKVKSPEYQIKIGNDLAELEYEE